MLLLASHRSNCGALNPKDMMTSGFNMKPRDMSGFMGLL